MLAKSADSRFPNEALTLGGHSSRVEQAARALLRTIGPDLRRGFGLDDAAFSRLEKLCTVASILHDIGKATASFQATVEGSTERHPWRHEHLSAGVIQGSQLRPWLAQSLNDDDLALLSMMVAGHHLRARNDMANARCPRNETLLLAHPQLMEVWQRAAILLGLDTLPSLEDRTLDPDAGSDLIQDYVFQSADNTGGPQARTPLLPIGKALVIAADTVGSAHADGMSIEEWVDNVLSNGLTTAAIERVVESRLDGAEPRSFQRRVAESDSQVTVVVAGCGNGKTSAAYLWAARQAAGRRLAFCYPTTGTTTAGFNDYLLAQNDLERQLLHSRAQVDIEAFQRSPDHEEPLDIWASDVLSRWSAQVVACTADTVLGLMTNWRSALISLPLWAKCTFIFDEVHSYDRQLFGALLEFVSIVRAPLLLMTASLSHARRTAILEAAGTDIPVIQGDPVIEAAPRYRLLARDGETCFPDSVRAVERGERVLWVVNTVSRAQAAYRALRDALGTDRVRVYHSRFRYADRSARQAEILDLFRAPTGVIVVATQVCEMSLDLSADLMVTELAPFPALIQRLGRLNRRDPVPAGSRPCLWYRPDRAPPYQRADLEAAADVLATLGEGPVSQRDLSDTFAGIEEPPYDRRVTPFLGQTWTTFPVPLRETTPSWTVVRRGDLPAGLSRIRRADVVRNEISMPPRGSMLPDWPRIHGAMVVPDDVLSYSLEEGASWAD